MSEEKLRIAVVGLGKMGLVHASMLKVLPNVELAALCEKSSMLRRFLKKAFRSVPVVSDLEELSELNLDAVYVTTPIPFHFEVAETIYREKIAKNVFVEKTLAANFSEAKQLCTFSEKANGTDMVGYLRRFYVTFAKAKSLLSENAIGHVSSFKAYAFSSDFLDTRSDEGQGTSSVSYSKTGVLEDLGCYAIDLAIWYFGDLGVSSGNGSPEENQQKSVRFKLENGKGLSGTVESSWSIAGFRMPEVGFSIEGSDGSIDVTDDKVELRTKDGKSPKWYRQNLEDNVRFWLGLPEYFREDECFVSSVMKKRRTEPDFASASKVDRIIELVKNGA